MDLCEVSWGHGSEFAQEVASPAKWNIKHAASLYFKYNQVIVSTSCDVLLQYLRAQAKRKHFAESAISSAILTFT